ncbi:hypothetical protein VP01_11381g1 [Puccinia sorghi]|uniref:Helicase ATP-binding domain-containing protein n=1 Tax=Puccinia sorghi TaxID=27349 RepID=A0A0L6VS84_9BASI|nr:hypothetical protein VP01_11381g1 [Puccinia sorghi]
MTFGIQRPASGSGTHDMGLGKTLTPLALIVTSKIAAEAFANTTEKRAKATLVICPLSTLANWEAKIHKHLDLNNTKYTIYHGEARKKLTGHMLWDYDIMIATYNTISNQYESDGGALFEGTWFRTILYEAQIADEKHYRGHSGPKEP